jgi:hypothetical protein
MILAGKPSAAARHPCPSQSGGLLPPGFTTTDNLFDAFLSKQ